MKKAYLLALIFLIPFPIKAETSDVVRSQYLLEQDAKRLERQGNYDEAIKKYNESLQIEKSIYGPRGVRPVGAVARALQKQGKFAEALEKIRILRQANDKKDFFIDRENEIVAILESLRVKTPTPVYEYVDSLKRDYQQYLPPNGNDVTRITTILRLYDFLGDHDAGIQFIDVIMEYLKASKASRNEDEIIYDRIKTVKQADECLQVKASQGNSNWHACRLIREYLLVREAFEKDKAEGFKGCLQAKEGEVCMGRATKALIDSDYFPW